MKIINREESLETQWKVVLIYGVVEESLLLCWEVHQVYLLKNCTSNYRHKSDILQLYTQVFTFMLLYT